MFAIVSTIPLETIHSITSVNGVGDGDSAVGEFEGLENDGDMVGDWVGDLVGDSVGDCVGDSDGDCVGDSVGDCVGDTVGD